MGEARSRGAACSANRKNRDRHDGLTHDKIKNEYIGGCMFDLKKKEDSEDIAVSIENEAEQLFRSKKMNCAEAALAALKNHFSPHTSDEITHLATGFGGGSASGCICGAVVGSTMAMGLVVTNDRKRLSGLTKELHKWFTETYGAACCRTIVAKQKGICASLTGKVAGKAAELLLQG